MSFPTKFFFRAEIQKEIRLLKKDYQEKKRTKKEEDDAEKEAAKLAQEEAANELVQEYKSNLAKYSNMKLNVPLKGSARESFTMQMLSKFKNKLKELKEDAPTEPITAEDIDDDNDTTNWYIFNSLFI